MMWALLLFPLASFGAPESFFSDLDNFRSRSLSLQTEMQRLESASVRALSRSLHWTPDLNANLNRQRNWLNRVPGPVSDSLSVTSTWNLFRGGSDWRASQAASLLRDAQALQVESESLALEARVGKLLFQSLYLRDAIQAQRELLKSKDEGLRIARERYSQGKLSLQEITKIEVDLSQQKNRFRSAELEYEQNQVALRSLFVDEFRTKDWPFSPSQKLSFGQESSPALKSLMLRAEGAQRSWQAARLLHMPSLNLNVSYRMFPLSSRDNTQWAGSVDLTFPLWNRYATSANAAEALAQQAEASSLAATREREESLRRDFLRKKIELSKQSLEESRQNLEKSERLYQDMLRSFRLGRLSANDLFLEQNRRIDSMLSYSQSRLSFHESLVEACALWGQAARECLR